jgi:creatinine amidohydrolase
MPELTGMTWREVRAAAQKAIAVLPIGSQEQHAGHLPMGTDTMLAEAVTDRALERLGGDPAVVRLPALPFGHSPHHLFAAAVSLREATLQAVLADVLDSLATSGFRRVLVVNGHGGNDEIMRLAVKDYALRADVALGACSYFALGEHSGSPGHAGHYETSLMLAAHPDLVRPREPRPDVTPTPLFAEPPYPGLTAERHGEWARAGGSTDDATAATAEDGAGLLENRVTALVDAIRAFDAATRATHAEGEA